MPQRAPHMCGQPGCKAIVRATYCDAHARKTRREADADRPSAALRGYGRRWQRARRYYLRRHPMCIACESKGQHVPAVVVDHITPHRGDVALFWNSDNWQSLCKRCHDEKTGRGE